MPVFSSVGGPFSLKYFRDPTFFYLWLCHLLGPISLCIQLAEEEKHKGESITVFYGTGRREIQITSIPPHWWELRYLATPNSKGALEVYIVFSNKGIKNFSRQLVFANLALRFCNLQFYIDTMKGYVFILGPSNVPNPSPSMSYFPFLTLKLEEIMWIYPQNFSIGTENDILKAVCVTFSFFSLESSSVENFMMLIQSKLLY